jgi:hypothetical protein
MKPPLRTEAWETVTASAAGSAILTTVLGMVAFFADRMDAREVSLLFVMAYTPFASVCWVGLVAWATHSRYATLVGLVATTPLRGVSLYLLIGDANVAAFLTGFFSLLELALGAVTVMTGASRLARIGPEGFRALTFQWPDPGYFLLLRVAGAGGSTVVFAGLGVWLYVLELVGPQYSANRNLSFAFALFALWFLQLSAWSTGRGALVPTWLGVLLGALVLGVVGALAELGISAEALCWVGLPVVVLGVSALPATLSGSAIAWLWRLSVEEEEELEEDAAFR